MSGHDIIVIGASAGGVEALKTLVTTIPADIPAAIFVALHISPHGTSVLPDILTRAGKLRAVHPVDGQAILPGHIYIAPPNHHLLVKSGYMTLTQGPKENGLRPAIDVLFRTAAKAYRRRVIAVVLSGVLDDGSAGMIMVKQKGGLGIVQDPDDALYSGMPQHAIAADHPDFVVPVSEIGALLARLAHEEVQEQGEDAVSVSDDTDVAELDENGKQIKEPGGTPSTYICPDCGGVMMEYHNGDLMRFRCQVGHAYSADSLSAKQSEDLENALWMALRSLDENASLTRRLADRARLRGHDETLTRYSEKLVDIESNAAVLRQILLTGKIVVKTEDEPHQA